MIVLVFDFKLDPIFLSAMTSHSGLVNSLLTRLRNTDANALTQDPSKVSSSCTWSIARSVCHFDSLVQVELTRTIYTGIEKENASHFVFSGT